MNPDSPFSIHGDEPVEARIVAWVLGEASAFEAAELERLCEERPELLVFRRRMRALHGLLTEAEAAQPDEGWKLPEEKRKVLDEIFGEEETVRLEAAKEKRIRHSGRRAFLAIAACLLFTLVVLRLMPWKQFNEAETILEVKPRVPGMAPLGSIMSESTGANRMTPQFFGTEFEKIKSRQSLEKVVDGLELTRRWGVDKETALKRLKDNIKTENIKGTDLMSIRVKEANPADARDIAEEVAKSYKAYRSEIEQRDSEQALHELNKAVRDQEDKVEERRKVLATIERTKGAIDKSDEASNREESIKRGIDQQDLVDAKRDFETDQQLLQTMKLKQIGETISSKMPGQSVEVHEAPVITGKTGNALDALASGVGKFFSDKDAPATEVADAGLAKSAERVESLPAVRGMIVDRREPEAMVPLTTDLPKEQIEGTPKPMNVPNLEIPKDGPAGSSSWAQTRSTELEEEPGERYTLSTMAPVKPAARPMPSSDSRERRVMAEGASSSLSIPEPSDTFSDIRSESGLAGNGRFSGGLGGGSGSGSGMAAPPPAALPVTPASPAAVEPAGEVAMNDVDARYKISKSEAAKSAPGMPVAQPPVIASPARMARPRVVPTSVPEPEEKKRLAGTEANESRGSLNAIDAEGLASGKPADAKAPARIAPDAHESSSNRFNMDLGKLDSSGQNSDANGEVSRDSSGADRSIKANSDSDSRLGTDVDRFGRADQNRELTNSILLPKAPKAKAANAVDSDADRTGMPSFSSGYDWQGSSKNTESAAADPLADESVATKRSGGTAPLTKNGAGSLDIPSESSGGAGGGGSADDLGNIFTAGNRSGTISSGVRSGIITSGNRSGDAPNRRANIDDLLKDQDRIADEKATADKKLEQSDKVPVLGDVPVLGTLYSNANKSDLAGNSGSAQNKKSLGTNTLSGANTYNGGTIVSGGKLGIGGGHTTNAPASSSATLSGASSGPGTSSELAEREMIRRQVAGAEGDKLLPKDSPDDGIEAPDKHEVLQAELGYLRKQLEDPAISDSKKQTLFNDWKEKQREVAQSVDPLRTNPALTYEQTENVDKVRRGLYTAEGNYNLGKFDDAKHEYENVLRADPYNTAARHGMERIAQAKSDYYRAAYDHTRAELLTQVDAAWGEVPADDKSKGKGVKEDFDGFVNDGSPIAAGKPAEPPVLPDVAASDSVPKTPAKVEQFWDTSKAAETNNLAGGVEYDIHTGYSNEYLFRGLVGR